MKRNGLQCMNLVSIMQLCQYPCFEMHMHSLAGLISALGRAWLSFCPLVCLSCPLLIDCLHQKAARKLPVQLEGVRPISVRCLSLKICWQIDDHDGIKGAFLQYCTPLFSRSHGQHEHQKLLPIAIASDPINRILIGVCQAQYWHGSADDNTCFGKERSLSS